MIKICAYCKQEFKADRKKALFCSNKCRGLNDRGKKRLYLQKYYGRGPQNQFIKECIECKKKFIVTPSRNTTYCSRDCFNKHIWNYTGKCYVCDKRIEKGKYCKECIDTNKFRKKFYYKKSWLTQRKRQWEKKLEIIKQLGGKCIICGIQDIRVLDINHLKPENKPKYKNGGHTTPRRLKDWLKNIKDLTLLCANCHRIYTWEQRKYGLDLETEF